MGRLSDINDVPALERHVAIMKEMDRSGHGGLNVAGFSIGDRSALRRSMAISE